ncbi:hypothetical protein ABZ192_36955 [Streptomyces sp. NPDC006235]|uniref:TolB family protein n=1 Tax=Streptomyces sp. NPDC006235 TaxID=3156736 RepID=UPI0033BE5538
MPAAGDRKTAATRPSLSADGKRVAYQFFVPHPAPGDWSDACVRDVPSGELFHADRAPDGVQSDRQTESPRISADGRYAVFNSLDSQLTSGETNQGHNVFVRDLNTGGLRRIDAADPTAFTAYPQLSADNRYLAFVSADPGDTSHTTRAYVRDLRTGRTVLASPDAEGRTTRACPPRSSTGTAARSPSAAPHPTSSRVTRTTPRTPTSVT